MDYSVILSINAVCFALSIGALQIKIGYLINLGNDPNDANGKIKHYLLFLNGLIFSGFLNIVSCMMILSGLLINHIHAVTTEPHWLNIPALWITAISIIFIVLWYLIMFAFGYLLDAVVGMMSKKT